jgi:membrane-associated phospholipid phosphatase
MKSKFTLLAALLITLVINVNAQSDVQPVQMRMESVALSNQYLGFKMTPARSEVEHVELITPKLVKDSQLIKVDTTYKFPVGYKTHLPEALIVPAALIVYGITTIHSHGLYSSFQARADLLKLTHGHGNTIDNYLIVAPYLEFGALLLLKVKCNSDLINTFLLIAKSELLMLAITYPMKYIVGEERPYSYYNTDPNYVHSAKANPTAFQSMPSGHTAEAFVAATIVYREYRHLSPWYGVGAYVLATTVGAFRMINDQHWMSDVFVGAGCGILSANIVYATHQHRWGRNGVCVTPVFDGKNLGGAFVYSF